MKEFTHVIADELGIHARPAGQLVKVAGSFKSAVSVTVREKTADAKRILGIMGLAAKKGESITVRVEGEDEEAASAQLNTFFKENL